jgi:adenylate kinase
MKLILITGVDRPEKDSFVDFNLNRSRGLLPGFENITFEDFADWKLRGQELTEKLNAELEKAVIGSFKSNKNVILLGRLTVPGKTGYRPLLSEQFFGKFSPDLILVFEHDTGIRQDFLIKKRFGSRESMEKVAQQQELNRSFAADYSAASGAQLRIIRIQQDNLKQTIREMVDTLTGVMEK